MELIEEKNVHKKPSVDGAEACVQYGSTVVREKVAPREEKPRGHRRSSQQ